MTDAEIAQSQGVSRQAIKDRRYNGWTQQQIEDGFRKQPDNRRYNTGLSKELGRSVAELAEEAGVTVSEIYRRIKASKNGKVPRTKKEKAPPLVVTD